MEMRGPAAPDSNRPTPPSTPHSTTAQSPGLQLSCSSEQFRCLDWPGPSETSSVRCELCCLGSSEKKRHPPPPPAHGF